MSRHRRKGATRGQPGFTVCAMLCLGGDGGRDMASWKDKKEGMDEGGEENLGTGITYILAYYCPQYIVQKLRNVGSCFPGGSIVHRFAQHDLTGTYQYSANSGRAHLRNPPLLVWERI